MAEALVDQNKNESGCDKSDFDFEHRCGWRSWRPNFLQRFVSPKWFILVISVFSLTQGIIVNGLVAVSIPDIEKEFGFTSAQSGLILAFNDVAGIMLVPIVSFFGAFAYKPKWIGYGALVTGLGALLFSMPKALVGKYDIPGTGTSLFCNVAQRNGSSCLSHSTSSSSGHLALLCLAQFIMGAGTTPLYTLGPTYLDENVNPKVSPIYLGIWFATTFLGPGLGFMTGGSFLGVFTDLKLPKGVHLTRRDPRWIGAWWLGFFMLSWSLFISAALMLCFPRAMPAFRKKRDKALQDGSLPTADKDIKKGVRGFLTATFRLMKNITFICSVLGLTVRVFFASAIGSFFAKIVMLKFGGSSYEVAISVGSVMLPAMAGGIMAGAMIMKKIQIKDSAKKAALLCVCLSVLTCFGATIFLIPGCQTTLLAGSTTSYHNRNIDGSFLSPCNSKCGCSLKMYAPVCGSDGKTYFSPCFAGCRNPVSKTQFTNCLCIPKKPTTGLNVSTTAVADHARNASIKLKPNTRTANGTRQMQTIEATFGVCDRQCKNMVFFLIASFFLMSLSFLSATPQKMILLRCVPDNQRAYALGLQFFIMRSLSFIPGPVIFGSLIDSQCIAWRKKGCGKRGNCLDYHVHNLSKNIVYLGIATGLIGTMFYFLAWYFYKPAETEETRKMAYNAEKGLLTDAEVTEETDRSAVL